MADKFGGQKDGRQSTGATFYDVPAETVNANALYFPNFPASPFFGVAEYPVAAGDLGAFSTSGVFVFDKPAGWIDNAGRKVFYRPKTAATGEIVAQEIKGDVFVGYQIIDNINPLKLGVLLASPEFCMNVLMVTSTADSGAGSLRQAIADAQEGDVILFDADVFPTGQTTSILLSSYITINKSVSIYGGFSDGNGGYTSGAAKRYYVYRDIEGVKTKVYIDDDNPAQEGETVLFENVCRVALDGQEAVRCVYANSTEAAECIISGVAFINGVMNAGGAMRLQGTSKNRIIDCDFKNCNADNYGGAISTAEASVNVISRCSLSNCSSDNGGAIFSTLTSQNTLTDCAIDSCTATSGGGVYSSSTSKNTINGCVFDSCSSSNGGGFFSSGTSQNTLNDCTITDCSATNGGGGYSGSTSQNTLNGCIIDDCSASSGGGVYSTNTSTNTLNDCTITDCSVTNGGGVYSANTSANTLNGCTFDGCSATNSGGGVYSGGTSQNTLNNCTMTGCSATTYGGGVYIYNESECTLNDCTITNCSANSGGGIVTSSGVKLIINNCSVVGNNATQGEERNDITIGTTSPSIINASTFGYMTVGAAGQFKVESGVTTLKLINLLSSSTSTPTIIINDGAALTITDTATIGAATFTSDGRGFLATAAGIDTSAATLDGVVLCSYGAGLESFDISADGATWTADDLTTPILIETRDAGGDWQTLTDNATGGEYATTFALESTARAFDGVAFFVATLPGYWQADAGAVDANDWSVRGFAASNSNGGGDADAAQGWTVTPSTVTPNADGV